MARAISARSPFPLARNRSKWRSRLQDRAPHRHQSGCRPGSGDQFASSRWATWCSRSPSPKRRRWSTPPRRSVSGVVGEQQVKDLPLNGRSFDNLITLNPGAINYSAMKSANTSTSNGNTFSVAGRRTIGKSVPAERHRIHRIEPARDHARRRQRRTAGHRRHPRVQRAHRCLRRRIRQTRRRAGQRGHAIRDQLAAWLAVRISAQQRSGCAQLLRSGVALRRSAETSSAARWAGR